MLPIWIIIYTYLISSYLENGIHYIGFSYHLDRLAISSRRSMTLTLFWTLKDENLDSGGRHVSFRYY